VFNLQNFIQSQTKFYFHSMQSNLASLLKTAEELRIKGLAEVSWRDDENGESPEQNNNDSNNNNVTETNGSSFPSIPQTQSSNHHQPSSSPSSSSASTNHNHQMGPLSQSERKEYDNKENLLKAMPFLAPLSSPKDLSSLSRKKRGRPPLDESNNFTRT
jgi:hypothetical protein